jgi:hypothetical protein
MIACSSVTTFPIETSQAMGGKSDFVNQSVRSWSRMGALINLSIVSTHEYDQICGWKRITGVRSKVMYRSRTV